MTVKRKLNFVNHGTYAIPQFPGVDEAEKGINWSKWVRGMKFANATFISANYS